MLRNLLRGLSNLIYPNNCLVCKKSLGVNTEETLCADCRSTIETNGPPFCLRCSRHVGCTGEVCRDCRRNRYYFDRAWAATFYNQTMQELIHSFKYHGKTSLRKNFSALMASFLKNHRIPMDRFDLSVAIPLHTARLRERGYNQSQLLCEGVCDEFCLPQSVGNLVRRRHTQNQALLKEKERWTNIEGAFTIKDLSEFLDKSVLIVDDLLTTGATASEAARTLKKAGAKQVTVLTLAITQ